ncbi:MAG: pyridoxal-phosphate dependent enzyme [Candidatus Gracilibacteria bacterium]|nr:pyridoxal-phosphate dependent enzyme [Candidatus Gracilibacteria bacterium]
MKVNIEKLLIEVPITKIQGIQKNEVYALLEKFNIGGSIKIKTVYWILKKAIESGELNSNKIILEASSGNTAISLAYLANLFDMKVQLIVPASTASCKKKLIRSYGAELIEVEGVTDDSIEYRDKLYKENPDRYFLADQFNNIANLEAHYNLTGPYIEKKIGKIDFFVAGLGTAGTLLGTGKYLKEKFPEIRIIAINPLDKVEGIKNYKIVRNIGDFYKKYNYLIDEIIDVSFEKDAVSGINDYIKEGYFNGISSGAILSGTKRYLEGKKGLKGLIIAPDGGDYYFGEIFKFIEKDNISGCK